MLLVPAWASLLTFYVVSMAAFAIYACVLGSPAKSDDDEPLIPPMM
jgi:hypothetical protein